MDHMFIEDVAAAVEIPEAGTLSRVLAKHGSVRLVAFAFDRDEELTEHTASVPAILQVISGRLRIGVANETYEMAPGAWLVMDAGVEHSVKALEPSRLLLTMIRCP